MPPIDPTPPTDLDPPDGSAQAWGSLGGGAKVDPERVKYWEVLGTMKWGIMCTIMVTAFKTGADRSVERAAIGRRSSETEIDLLRLLAPRQ